MVAVTLLPAADIGNSSREHISLDADWRFQKGDPKDVDANNLLYDVRPEQKATDGK